MRWLVALVWTAVAVAGYGQEHEAEKLFRSMEKKVREAKSLKMVCEVEGRTSEGREHTKLKACQQFADANKARFELRVEKLDYAYHTLFVSDGTKMVTRNSGDVTAPKSAEADLNKGLPAAIARGGFMLPRLLIRPKGGSFDADKTLLVSTFRLGPKERVGRIEGQVVELCVRFGDMVIGPGRQETIRVIVWIDPKTLIPLKRKVFVGKGEEDFFTEVYTEFVLDPQLDAKVFELPK